MSLSRYENKFAIYQLKKDEDGDNRRFMNYEWHQKKGITPKIEDYDLIYIGELPSVIKNMNRTLEQIYEKFNLDHPANYRGYSLSVSDVVAINRGGKLSYHFCDSAGQMRRRAHMETDERRCADHQRHGRNDRLRLL